MSKQLFVEGSDDLHSICHLLQKLRNERPRKFESWFGGFKIQSSGSDNQALGNFQLALKSDPASSVMGIVLDADDQQGKRFADRWAAIFEAIGIDPLIGPHTNGWVGTTQSGLKCGSWVWPDNVSDGGLEALLVKLVPDNDKLWKIANDSVGQAIAAGAGIKEFHRSKAHIHTWLAWRKEPGRPYGRAIECGDLIAHQSPISSSFADWVDRLYS